MTLAFLALAWLLGISAAAFTDAHPAALVAAASLLGAVSIALSPRPATLALVAVGVVTVFGAGLRYSETQAVEATDSISRLNGAGETRFRAIVVDEPDDRLTSRVYRLETRKALQRGRWQEASGGVLLRTAPTTTYRYGDLIEIRGTLEDPPELEEFDYREYLARRGIRSIVAYPETRLLASGQGDRLKAEVINVRSRLTRALDRSLPEPESSLAAGVLLGSRGSLPRDLKNAMDASGTSHLVAVSGPKVTPPS